MAGPQVSAFGKLNKKRSRRVDIIDAIIMRKSIRDFKADLVPKKILREILETSARAPSAENSQPWEFTIVAGDVLMLSDRRILKNFEFRSVSPIPTYKPKDYLRTACTDDDRLKSPNRSLSSWIYPGKIKRKGTNG